MLTVAGRWLVVSVPGVVVSRSRWPRRPRRRTRSRPQRLAAANAEDTITAAATMTTRTVSLRAIRA